MTYSSIVISSGHSKFVRGASGVLDEVNEARKVVERVADELGDAEVDVFTFHDDTSHSQNENLNAIVAYHNSCDRDLDVSIHFNAYVETQNPMGTECLYVTQDELSAQMANAIAGCGFKNRGPKKRTDLFFLNNTDKPAILIEVCFVDSHADADIYNDNFDEVCRAIASTLSGRAIEEGPDEPEAPEAALSLQGKCSWFGGPEDTGVSPNEGLAFIYEMEAAPHLFLPFQPEGTNGLARRLNPHIHFIACRWDYTVTPKTMLLDHIALVRSVKTGVALTAFPADWGPHVDTGRIADLSKGLMDDLKLTTDDEVIVTFPYIEAT